MMVCFAARKDWCIGRHHRVVHVLIFQHVAKDTYNCTHILKPYEPALHHAHTTQTVCYIPQVSAHQGETASHVLRIPTLMYLL